MTKDTTATALWDSMTDQQKIEWLATEVMNGEINPDDWIGCICGDDTKWNPLTDWNHWREVEVEAARDWSTWHEFMHILGINTTGTNVPADCSKMYVRTPLPNRAKALFLSLQ